MNQKEPEPILEVFRWMNPKEAKTVLRAIRDFTARDLHEISRELAKLREAPEWVAKWRSRMERNVLLIEWQLLPGPQLRRWRRVQALRDLPGDLFKAQFGETKTVAAIWQAVADETRTTPAAIDQSCKRIVRLKNNIERLNERLGLDRHDLSFKRR
jgi:hypothetical protein